FIIEKTGMDIKRFTKSILLAQGSFSAFLKASPDERGPILEQITGTEIYSNVSIQIHEQQRLEADKLELLQAKCRDIKYLNVEEEDKLVKELQELSLKEDELISKVKILNNQINWITKVNELSKELDGLKIELNNSEDEIKNNIEEINNFKLSIKAHGIRGDYQVYQSLKNSLFRDRELLSNIKKDNPKIESEYKEGLASLTKAKNEFNKAKELGKIELELISRVKVLDINISVLKEELNSKSNELKLIVESKNSLNREIATKELELKELESSNIATIEYLKLNKDDENLLSEYSGIEELFLRKEELSNRNIDVLYKELNIKINKLKDDSTKIDENISNKLNGRQLTEYKKDLSSLIREQKLIERIISLEEHRSQLIDGTPCPLCGSLEHPFASTFNGEQDKVESDIFYLEQFINDVEELSKKVLEINNTISILESDAQNKKNILNELENLNLKLNEKISKYSNVNEINDLKARKNEWLKQSSLMQNFSNLKRDLEQKVVLLRSKIENKSEEYLKLNTSVSTLKNNLTELESKRFDLYGEKNTCVEEKKVSELITLNENKLENIEIYTNELYKKLTENTTSIKNLDERICKSEEEFINLELEINTKIVNEGFKDIDDFLQFLIPVNEYIEKEKRVNDIKERNKNIKFKYQEKISLYNIEKEKDLTQKSKSELLVEDSELNSLIKDVNLKIGAIHQSLENSRDAKKIVQEKILEIEKQEKELNAWKKLHVLIGSADGKKFRNFAQGLTFERMISYANFELEKMTKRYLLVQDYVNPLDINILDFFQSGVIRSTKNLSGGESFIVSLALALGLSKMSSNRVRVDSLFLDEGFGTLDDEALEVALEALSSLHGEGKLIGVISHVAALKERISTQITVSKGAGGRGFIKGPGVSNG
ncbi:MAG: hypothetical protein JXR64_02710, partial [Spirochaetales bacterium]|nr:hypothetical protein [Spirochaetales bacterium]